MTPIIKVIKTDEDYKAALNLVEELVNKDPEPESEDGEKLALLATLIQDYESRTFPLTLPDPIDAILFRMEQQGLKPSDLVAYIGSRSKVSEILSRKRPLTLSMIRSLEVGLSIPAEVLLKESGELRSSEEIVWTRFPSKEMSKRGYFGEKLSQIEDVKTALEAFFKPIHSPVHFFGALRKTSYRSARPMDKYALTTWSTFIVKKAEMIKFKTSYKPKTVDLTFMQTVARLSSQNDGPILARNLLENNGIALVIERHFEKTYLDGATIMINKEHPIIGLTLRFDRLDNFWFTLMHELAHIALHSNQNSNFFYDDLDAPDSNDQREQEADQLALEALVPKIKWENSAARLVPSPIAAESLAKELQIHTAIVAGRMRREGDRYMYLNKIVNESKIRCFFPEAKWEL